MSKIIFVIEGGKKAKTPFGIESIKVSGKNWNERYIKAEKICKRTIINNYRRWNEAGKPGLFCEFLGKRYCPPSASRINHNNWIRNYKFYAKKEGVLF